MYGGVSTTREWWIMSKLPSYSQALDSTLSVVQQVSVLETVPLESAMGRYLGSDIVADRDLPPFNRSQMDGFAVVASEVVEGVSMNVLGNVAAGTTYDGECQPITCVAIATGAPVPDCFDAVIQHELTHQENGVVTFHCGGVSKGKSIHPQGVDAKEGEVLVSKQVTLSPQHIGIAASVGYADIKVFTKPRVVVISSGDEVVSPSMHPLPHQIRNGNNPMVAAALSSMGCEVVEAQHVLDDQDATKKAIEEALDGRCDLVVTIGGISAGKRDFFPEVFEKMGVELVVKGANIQPGKPVIVGKHENAIVLGLPGNPVSALACCCVFGWPMARRMLGCSATIPWQSAPLATAVKPNQRRTAFRPCQLADGKVNIPQWQGSGDLSHTTTTNGLAQLPSSDGELEVGTLVTYLEYPWC